MKKQETIQDLRNKARTCYALGFKDIARQYTVMARRLIASECKHGVSQ